MNTNITSLEKPQYRVVDWNPILGLSQRLRNSQWLRVDLSGSWGFFPNDGILQRQKDDVSKEQILRVIFLDPERPNPALEKLKRQLAEADAAVEARKKPPEETSPKMIGEGLVINEWKERRERYLAQQQGKGVEYV